MPFALLPRCRTTASGFVATSLVIGALLLLAGSSPVRAEAEAVAPGQEALQKRLDEIPSGEAGVKQVLASLDERLDLSPGQIEQIRPIVVDAVADMEKIRDRFQAGEITPMALVMQLQIAGQKSATLIEPHLSEAQAVDYAAMRQEQKRRMMQEMKKARAAAMGGGAP